MTTAKPAFAKPTSAAEKHTKTTSDTIVLTPLTVNQWLSPPFQRAVKENAKVKAFAEELRKNGGVMTGVITLGCMNGKFYIIDGQHRKAAFLLSGVEEGYADIRIHYVDSFAEMGEEFVKLNSQLARMNPDDILRGLEESIPLLSLIRRQCHFVGYDHIRRNMEKGAILSMSACLRAWKGSELDTPGPPGGSAIELAGTLIEGDVTELCGFLGMCFEVFGRDVESRKLWSGLNMLMCMWLYRRSVLGQSLTKSMKTTRLTKEQFRKCLASLAASAGYAEWLVGRNVGERDRNPTYSRIKTIFGKRLIEEGMRKPMFPAPAWDTNNGRGRFKGL